MSVSSEAGRNFHRMYFLTVVFLAFAVFETQFLERGRCFCSPPTPVSFFMGFCEALQLSAVNSPADRMETWLLAHGRAVSFLLSHLWGIEFTFCVPA